MTARRSRLEFRLARHAWRIREFRRLIEAYGFGKRWKKWNGFGQIRLLETGKL